MLNNTSAHTAFSYKIYNDYGKILPFSSLRYVAAHPYSRIIGYHFLRCFCIGRAFHGLIVDPLFSGQGIGAQMWRIAYQIAQQQGITLFATISDTIYPL